MQVILEVPIEASNNALRILGGIPNPESEVWVAVARIDPDKSGKEPSLESEKERKPFNGLPRAQQAGMACGDIAFQRYLSGLADTAVPDADACARVLRTRLGISSRAILDKDSAKAVAWDSLYAAFLRWSGRTPEAR